MLDLSSLYEEYLNNNSRPNTLVIPRVSWTLWIRPSNPHQRSVGRGARPTHHAHGFGSAVTPCAGYKSALPSDLAVEAKGARTAARGLCKSPKTSQPYWLPMSSRRRVIFHGPRTLALRGTAGCTKTRHLRCSCCLLTCCYCIDCTRPWCLT